MDGAFARTELLIGPEGIEKLKNSTVAVFGVGGVGSFVVEALARCNIGKLILIDDDDICITNINRQLHATTKTIGMSKVDVMATRARDINPEIEIVTHKKLYTAENSDKLLLDEYDYVVDAIDMVSAKLDLVVRCTEMNIQIISSMGAGNKLNPAEFEVADIYKTSVCPLAKVMRQELKKRGVRKLKVVYSKELPLKPYEDVKANPEDCQREGQLRGSNRRQTPGSIAFVPSVVGLIIASEVVKDLLK